MKPTSCAWCNSHYPPQFLEPSKISPGLRAVAPTQYSSALAADSEMPSLPYTALLKVAPSRELQQPLLQQRELGLLTWQGPKVTRYVILHRICLFQCLLRRHKLTKVIVKCKHFHQIWGEQLFWLGISVVVFPAVKALTLTPKGCRFKRQWSQTKCFINGTLPPLNVGLSISTCPGMSDTFPQILYWVKVTFKYVNKSLFCWGLHVA